MALKEAARECGLSVGHFSHAFRRTLGVAPHKWSIDRASCYPKKAAR
ncbi:helix-turn-helix transcriptional regulator [Bradyrhizobium sp. LA6.12]